MVSLLAPREGWTMSDFPSVGHPFESSTAAGRLDCYEASDSVLGAAESDTVVVVAVRDVRCAIWRGQVLGVDDGRGPTLGPIWTERRGGNRC